MKKRILSLLMAVALCMTLAVTAYADAILLPEEAPAYDITSAHYANGSCKVLNVFLSNFAEAGVTEYDQNDSDSLRMAVVLKHLELNAELYAKNVKKVEGEDGKTYMRITASEFEKRAKRLFGKSISAADCPGYEDGAIVVSAEHFGGPIQVFASVTNCSYVGSDFYFVQFQVFLTEKEVSKQYRIANRNLEKDSLTLLGTGEALVEYSGGETTESISTSDFAMISFSMDAADIPCTGENLPYGAEPTEPPTEAPVAETLTATAPAATTEATEAEETAPVPEKEDTPPAGLSTGVLVLLVALVLVISVLTLVIILLVCKRK